TALGRLKQYVANGGNVVWFTGEKVDRTYYNDILFDENEGLFPVPIQEVKSGRLSDKDIDAQRRSSAPKIFVLDKQHDVTRGLSGVDQRSMADLLILQYTEAMKRLDWTRPWSHESDVKDLIALGKLTPNDDIARRRTVELLNAINPDDPKLRDAKVKERLKKLRDEVLKVSREAREDEMYRVVEAIDLMLNDRGDKPNDKDNVSL